MWRWVVWLESLKEPKPEKQAHNDYPPPECWADSFVRQLLPVLLSGFGIPLFYNARLVSGDDPGKAPLGEPIQGWTTYPLTILCDNGGFFFSKWRVSRSHQSLRAKLQFSSALSKSVLAHNLRRGYICLTCSVVQSVSVGQFCYPQGIVHIIMKKQNGRHCRGYELMQQLEGYVCDTSTSVSNPMDPAFSRGGRKGQF